MTERLQGEKGLSQSQIDLRDRATELATDGGGPKVSRFLTGEQDPRKIKERESKRRREQMIGMADRLASEAMIAACLIRIDELQSRLDDAFADLEKWEAEMESRTLRLEDGSAIYLLENGRFCTVEGQVIPQSYLPEGISEDAVTWAERQAYLRRVDQLARIQEDVIDPGREKLASGEATEQDIADLEREISEAERTIEDPAYESTDKGLTASHDTPNADLFKDLPPTL